MRCIRRFLPAFALALTCLSGVAATVDVLVAYDRPAISWVETVAGLTPEAFAADAIARLNEVLANSQLDSHFTFRLAGTHAVDTDVCYGASAAEVGPKFAATLAQIPEGGVPWSGLRAFRDEVAADLVVVLVDTGDRYGVAGLGNSLRKDAPIADYAPYAYCLCSIRSVADSYTMMHEVGHLMGAGHPDTDPYGLVGSDLGPQYGPSSSAFTDTENHRVTVMGYSGKSCKVIPYFSSPQLVLDGVTLGDARHDNRQTLLDTYMQISQYRQADSGGGSSTGGDTPSPDGFNPTSAKILNGAYSEGDRICGVLQVKVGRASKGQSKVSVTLIGLDGRKYTAAAKSVPTGGTPMQTFEVKKFGTLALTFGANGFSGTLNGMAVTSVDGRSATTDGMATFEAGDLSSLAGVLTEYLPNEAVSRSAKKWAVKAKAGKLKYVKPNAAKGNEGGFVETGSNIAGLKLTYAQKTQTFKGSFKVWTFDSAKNKLKSVSAKVTGVVVDGTGYGEVTVKKARIGELTVR